MGKRFKVGMRSKKYVVVGVTEKYVTAKHLDSGVTEKRIILHGRNAVDTDVCACDYEILHAKDMY